MRVLDAGGARDEHESSDALGRGERDVQRDAAAQRVPAEREALRAAREHVRDACGERDRARALGRIAVAGQVERQRPVAFRVERRDHAVPRAARSAESVQQDDALRHADDPMTPTTDMYVLLRAFVDELARCGMRAACTSPGSRSAPLVLSLAREPRLRCYSHVDERCAGFFALGLAKASGLPVAVACTSGTAAAELLAAAVEAHEARVPLLLLTADRPAELRENGAGQAIDQLKLYGGAAKWFFEVAVHDAGAEQLRWMRTLACRAYWTALEGRPGVVHLNFPLREPLVSEAQLPEDATAQARRRAVRAPDAGASRPRLAGSRRCCRWWWAPRRGVLVAGRHERATPLGEAAAAFARGRGLAAAGRPAVGRAPRRSGDRPLRRAPARRALRGRDGAGPGAARRRSARVKAAAQLAGAASTACARSRSIRRARGRTRRRCCRDSLALEPAATLAQLSGALADASVDRADTDADWLASWRSADERAAEAIVGGARGRCADRATGRGRARRAAARGGDPVRRVLDAGT